jgi:transposase-like protein
MDKLPRQVYTTEFRRQAVELITRDGVSIAAAARRLAISPKTLLNRVRRTGSGTLPEAGAAAPRHVVTEEEGLCPKFKNVPIC